MVKTISQRTYAKLKGLNLSALQRHISEGRIPTEKGGKINFAKANVAWDANVIPNLTAGKAKKSQAPSHFVRARTSRERILTKLAQLELDKKSGKLISRDEVATIIKNLISTARTRLLGMGSRLAQQLAIENTPALCQALVDTEVNEALTDLSNYTPK